ncbi:hypothetical protein XENOCAPTIV_002433, partial [Xenoophorus captivus]
MESLCKHHLSSPATDAKMNFCLDFDWAILTHECTLFLTICLHLTLYVCGRESDVLSSNVLQPQTGFLHRKPCIWLDGAFMSSTGNCVLIVPFHSVHLRLP